MTRFEVQTYEGAVAMMRRGVRLDGPWIASLLHLEMGRPIPAEFVKFLAAPYDGTTPIYRGDPQFRRRYRKFRGPREWMDKGTGQTYGDWRVQQLADGRGQTA